MGRGANTQKEFLKTVQFEEIIICILLQLVPVKNLYIVEFYLLYYNWKRMVMLNIIFISLKKYSFHCSYYIVLFFSGLTSCYFASNQLSIIFLTDTFHVAMHLLSKFIWTTSTRYVRWPVGDITVFFLLKLSRDNSNLSRDEFATYHMIKRSLTHAFHPSVYSL